ncbi:MAG TPA: hypothetical protein PLR06_13230 [Cyclobacteriaceae bacterium]|nr:hypothetical protein [Cyclobacteriaceae bacterium]
MKRFIIILTLALAFTHHLNSSLAQSTAKNDFDPFILTKGKFNAGLLTTYTGTTPPPILIGDLTYGLSRKTSMGLMAGTIGTQSLMGLKLNTVIYSQNNFRVLFKMNMVYYPGRDGTYLFDTSIKQIMPWMFTLGIVNAEWKTKNNVRWSAGLGGLETHCIDGMMHFLQGTTEEEDDEDLPFEMFMTGYFGVSLPLSSRLTLRPEVVLVMKDFQLISTDKFKISPVTPYVNLTWRLGK